MSASATHPTAVLLKTLFFTVAALVLAAIVYAGWIVVRTWDRIAV